MSIHTFLFLIIRILKMRFAYTVTIKKENIKHVICYALFLITMSKHSTEVQISYTYHISVCGGSFSSKKEKQKEHIK